MKSFIVLLILLPCVCLLGCKKYEERIEQVVWENRTSYVLNIAVYIHDGDIWTIPIEKGAEVMVHNQTYRLCQIPKNIKSNEPAHYLPFEGPNWLCERGQIDSLVISDAATDLELMRCKKQYPSYRPFLDRGSYSQEYIDKGTVFTIGITDKMCALSRKECPCFENDTTISIENESGTIRFENYYAVWYFVTNNFPQKSYMFEKLPNQYRQENLQVSVTGMGKAVTLPKSWFNPFADGCLSDYSIEKSNSANTHIENL